MTMHMLSHTSLSQESVVTIGVFDGVHTGHQHLIRRMVADAHAANRLAVVVTFDPHPDVVLRGRQGRYYLTTLDEKADLLRGLGVDAVVVYPFNHEASQVRAVDFVGQLIERLRMAALWVGPDFALGYKREGDVAFLRRLGQAQGFTVHETDPLLNSSERVSSTAVRQALLAGEVERARALLGRSYSVQGIVQHGDKRGRQIGFPTANMAVWSEQVIPANGVYAGWASLGSERFMAVTNVGVRPTFGLQAVTVEAHLLDFDRDIYDQLLRFSFEKRLRPEQRFSGLDALMAQIRADADAGRAYLSAVG